MYIFMGLLHFATDSAKSAQAGTEGEALGRQAESRRGAAAAGGQILSPRPRIGISLG